MMDFLTASLRSPRDARADSRLRIVRSRLGWVAIAAVLPLAAVGCSAGQPASNRPQTHPAKGKVTMGGQPVGGATVTFRPDGSGNGCSGITNDAGEFKLSTFTAGDGAVPGKYRVTVTKLESTSASTAADVNSPAYVPPPLTPPTTPPAPPKSLLPETYADPAKSDLTAEVVGGKANVFDFDLKR